MPTFLLEEPYGQEEPGPDGNNVNENATQPVRRFWLPNVGQRLFTPPGPNSAGENDWVLVLDKQ